MTKKMGPKIIASIALVGLFAAAPTNAQNRSEPPLDRLIGGLLKKGPVWSEVEEFDVAGVKLGMSPEEARAALEAKGFKPLGADKTQGSWAARLSDEVAKRRNVDTVNTTVSMLTVARGDQGERIEVWYSATPEGAVASSVQFLIPTNRMEKGFFARSVEGKYGTVTYGEAKSGIFCSKGEEKCRPWEVQASPFLKVDSGYSFYEVYLAYGSDFKAGLKAQMVAQVESAAPKDAVATF